MIYNIVLFLLISSSIFEEYAKTFNEMYFSKVFRYLGLFLLFYLAAFRFETGGDWPGYIQMYEETSEKTIEPIFSWILKIARFFNNYQFIFIISMIVRYICLHIFIKFFCLKIVNNYSLFLLIYFCMFYFHDDFVTIRQSLAVGIFLLAFLNIERKSFKNYFLIVLLATCVHFSALILIFLYPFIFKVPSRYNFLLTIVLILFSLLHFDPVKTFIEFLYYLLPSNYITFMMFQYTHNASIAFSRGFSGTTYVYILLFLLLTYTFKSDLFSKQKLCNPLLNSICIYNMLFFGLFNYMIISLRLSMFFNLFVVLEVVLIVHKNFKQNLPISVLFILLAFAFNKNIFMAKPSAVAYLPYQDYFIYTSLNLNSTGKERLDKMSNITELNRNK